MLTVLSRSVSLIFLLGIPCALVADDAPTPSPATPASATASSAEPSTGSTTGPVAITWDQAKDHIGETVVVTGPVVGSHALGKAAVLNIGLDYPDPARFTVYIPGDKRADMPDDLDVGKTISVNGKIKLFHKVAEIQAGPAEITISGQSTSQSTTAPATQP